MKARHGVILGHAVSEGVKRGIRKFYKHRDDAPDQIALDNMADSIETAVLDEIDTWFDMEDEGE